MSKSCNRAFFALFLSLFINDVNGFVQIRGNALRVCSIKSVEVGTEGDAPLTVDDLNMTEPLDHDSLPMVPLAPPLTFDKYVTMQDKRVTVSIQYSGESGLKPYYLTVAKKIKAAHPDVIIERKILPSYEMEDATFEVFVDGKVVVGKNNVSIQKLGPDKDVQDATGGLSVFVSMTELELALSKARRRRRPETMYGKDDKKAVRLESLRGSDKDDLQQPRNG